MHVRKTAVFLIIAGLCLTLNQSTSSARSAASVINRVNQNFSKIKDTVADFTLDYNMHFFGCSGNRRFTGKLYYKYPDSLKIAIDDFDTYFATGNRIRKIDKNGKKFYVTFLNSLDFKVGFNPKLITENFYLKILQDNKEGIVIEGLPKPGILKNITKVTFHINPQEYLLRKLDLEMNNKRLSGSILINYEKIKGIWVPSGFQGNTAIEIRSRFLVGLDLSLEGNNFKINSGPPKELFDPGF